MVTSDQHTVLVGLTGSGKSTVGRLIAERLHRPLLDTDQMIEQRTGRSVRAIFADDGEPAFRELETEVLAEALATEAAAVIATGGGVVLREGNRSMLHDARVRVVWLRAEPAQLVERVRSGGHRPLLDPDPEGVLCAMAEVREPLYREVADVIISVDGRSLGDIVDAVLR